MYEDFYGLRDKPFALSPDPRFFYGSKGHRRAMAYLEYGLQQEEGFIVITGEVGAGKTTLVRSLFQSLSGKPVVAAQLVSTQLDADSLLRAVCLAFGLEVPGGDKALQLRQLEHFLHRTRADGRRALVVVDEAQNLDMRAVEELRMLSNFQSDHGALLQSFLLGQPEFRRILRSSQMQQLRQRVIATYHLGPMDAGDTRAYIEHRLTRAGWVGDPQLRDDAWVEIHAYTSGIPRQVNTFCDRLLLMGYMEDCHDFGVEQVRSVVAEMQDDLGGGRATDAAEAGAAAGDWATAPEVVTEGVEERLRRIERYLGINYKLLQQSVNVQREDQKRLGERLERLERYLVSSHRLMRQVGSTIKKALGVPRELS